MSSDDFRIKILPEEIEYRGILASIHLVSSEKTDQVGIIRTLRNQNGLLLEYEEDLPPNEWGEVLIAAENWAERNKCLIVEVKQPLDPLE